MTYSPLPRSVGQAHQARHLLALPGDVTVDEVEVLATSRFTATRWDITPAGILPGDVTSAPQGPRAKGNAPGILRVSRHATLTGPFAPQGDGFELGLPPGIAMVFDVVCHRERGEPPFSIGDRDGIGRAFAKGLPEREEGRLVTWLVAVARRLGGSLRVDVGGLWTSATASSGGPGPRSGTGVVLTPDADVAVDMSVYSNVWLEPEAALATVRPLHSRTRLATEGEEWGGPPAGIADRPLYPGEKMDPERRKELHAAADDFDIAALQGPQVLYGYGLLIDLGVDGIVVVEVAGEEHLPPMLRGLPWTADGAVRYRVHWEPPDQVEANQEQPGLEHRIARKRAAELVARIAGRVQDAVGGEIADEDEFLVDPADL
ncbi:hypothetical protein GCM10027059_05220 [Myceligenerans halotolerans]